MLFYFFKCVYLFINWFITKEKVYYKIVTVCREISVTCMMVAITDKVFGPETTGGVTMNQRGILYMCCLFRGNSILLQTGEPKL